MQEVVGWIILAMVVFVAWRLWRALKRSFASISAARAEAFSAAVSDAVASGVAQALAAAVADSHAAASGGNVAVHIGDNLARLLANDYHREHDDDQHQYDQHNGLLPVQRSSDGRSMGNLPDATRHGALAGRPPADRSIASSHHGGTADRGTVQPGPVER